MIDLSNHDDPHIVVALLHYIYELPDMLTVEKNSKSLNLQFEVDVFKIADKYDTPGLRKRVCHTLARSCRDNHLDGPEGSYLAVKAAFSTWLADKALKTVIAGLINRNMTHHLENNTFRRLLGESPLLGKFLLEGFYAGVTEHLLSKCTRCNIYSRGQMCPCCLSTSTLQGNKKQIRFLEVATPSVDQVRSKDSSDL